MNQDWSAPDDLGDHSVTETNTGLPGQTLIPAVVENVLGSLGTKAFHNFIGSPLDVWRQISIATGPDVVPADKKLDQTFLLRSFYVHQVPIPQQTPGEYKDCLRCVLISTTGEAFAYVSDGVAQDLGRIIAAFGMGPYTDGIPIKVKAFQTKRGFRAYTIQPG